MLEILAPNHIAPHPADFLAGDVAIADMRDAEGVIVTPVMEQPRRGIAHRAKAGNGNAVFRFGEWQARNSCGRHLNPPLLVTLKNWTSA